MFFAVTRPALGRRHVHAPAARSMERFLSEALQANRNPSTAAEQDDKSFTLRFDVPGIAREQLKIGIEGSVVRINTRDGAPRQYKAAYELPADIDVAHSDAKLEHGVLTLKLAKATPASKVTELLIS